MDLSSKPATVAALLQVEVASVSSEAQAIVAIELRAPGGADLPCFTAGSHIDVHLPNGVVRQYSLYNDPAETHRYCIAVLREAQGRGGSEAMHRLRAGDRLFVSAPRNQFALNDDAARHVLFAGGIGITPLAAMAQVLAREGRPFELHYFVRSRPRVALAALLEGLKPHVTVHVDEEQGPADLGATLRAAPERSRLYFCGPGGFMSAVESQALQAGWPAARLHKEHFAAPPPVAGAPCADRPFTVKLARSGRVVHVAADRTVADALAAEGVYVGISCGQGVCGACVTTVISGVPHHRDFVLSAVERESGSLFTPCCSRSLSAELVIDL